MTTEQKRAYNWYVKEHKTAKEIASKLGRTEKTIGNWVKKFGWKEQRTARVNSYKQQEMRIREILDQFAEQTLILLDKLKKAQKDQDMDKCSEIGKELASISDEASKWNKRLSNLQDENRITLVTYLQVMDDVFENMRTFDEGLYNRSLEFQESHLQTISLKLG